MGSALLVLLNAHDPPAPSRASNRAAHPLQSALRFAPPQPHAAKRPPAASPWLGSSGTVDSTASLPSLRTSATRPPDPIHWSMSWTQTEPKVRQKTPNSVWKPSSTTITLITQAHNPHLSWISHRPNRDATNLVQKRVLFVCYLK